MEGGGAQCTCTSLYFLCHCSKLPIPKTSISVDAILHAGTELYKRVTVSYQKATYLLANELPDVVSVVGGQDCKVEKFEAFSGLLGISRTDPATLTFSLLDGLVSSFQKACGCLVTVGHSSCAFTSAVYKEEDSFFCFDSHSRSSAGMCTPSGKAVILKLQSMSDLEHFICDLARSLFHEDYSEVPFELVPIGCMTPSCDVTIIATEAPEVSSSQTCYITAEEELAIVQASRKLLPERNSDDDDEYEQSERCLYPSGCSQSQFEAWQKYRPWLRCKKVASKGINLIGIQCQTCTEIGSLEKYIAPGKEKLSLSVEWIQGVCAKNSKKLHDKLYKHEKSKAHVLCVQLLEKKGRNVIEQSLQKSMSVWEEQNLEKISTLCKVFRTVYVVVWKHLPFRVHRHLFELQVTNGLKMGQMLFSHQSCSNICTFIASEMQKKLVEFVIQQSTPFSLLLDESTTTSNQTVLIVYARILDEKGMLAKGFKNSVVF